MEEEKVYMGFTCGVMSLMNGLHGWYGRYDGVKVGYFCRFFVDVYEFE